MPWPLIERAMAKAANLTSLIVGDWLGCAALEYNMDQIVAGLIAEAIELRLVFVYSWLSGLVPLGQCGGEP